MAAFWEMVESRKWASGEELVTGGVTLKGISPPGHVVLPALLPGHHEVSSLLHQVLPTRCSTMCSPPMCSPLGAPPCTPHYSAPSCAPHHVLPHQVLHHVLPRRYSTMCSLPWHSASTQAHDNGAHDQIETSESLHPNNMFSF